MRMRGHIATPGVKFPGTAGVSKFKNFQQIGYSIYLNGYVCRKIWPKLIQDTG